MKKLSTTILCPHNTNEKNTRYCKKIPILCCNILYIIKSTYFRNTICIHRYQIIDKVFVEKLFVMVVYLLSSASHFIMLCDQQFFEFIQNIRLDHQIFHQKSRFYIQSTKTKLPSDILYFLQHISRNQCYKEACRECR